MPFERNPHFVGREDEFARLQSLLTTTDHIARAAVLGMGPTKEKIVIDISDDDDEEAAQPEIRNEPVVRRERSTLSSFIDKSEHIPLAPSRVEGQES